MKKHWTSGSLMHWMNDETVLNSSSYTRCIKASLNLLVNRCSNWHIVDIPEDTNWNTNRDVHLPLFSEQVINNWNSHNHTAVVASNVDMFKKHLIGTTTWMYLWINILKVIGCNWITGVLYQLRPYHVLVLCCTIGDRSFRVTVAQTWNSLPTNVTASTSLLSFKRQLKTFLFTKSFPSL